MQKKAKVRVVTLDELTQLASRLTRVTRFNLTGAILCLLTAVYYIEVGSQLLPKVFGSVSLLALLLAILSYRTSYKLGKVIHLLKQKHHKK